MTEQKLIFNFSIILTYFIFNVIINPVQNLSNLTKMLPPLWTNKVYVNLLKRMNMDKNLYNQISGCIVSQYITINHTSVKSSKRYSYYLLKYTIICDH